jgi:hypothetical protein
MTVKVSFRNLVKRKNPPKESFILENWVLIITTKGYKALKRVLFCLFEQQRLYCFENGITSIMGLLESRSKLL